MPDTDWLNEHDLSDRERIFVLEYLVTLNQSEAARRAGTPNASAACWGSTTIRKPKVAAAIQEGRARIEAATQIRGEDVVNKLWALVNASPADITKLHHGACRYCYGADHQFHWKTEREFRDAFLESVDRLFSGKDLKALREQLLASFAAEEPGARDFTQHHLALPTDLGGFGYRFTRRPFPECPECNGLGRVYTRFIDTNDLDEAGRLIFDGVEETQHGIKMKFADRAAAMDKIAKHLGLYTGRPDGEEDPMVALGREIAAAAQSIPVMDQLPEQFADNAVNGPMPMPPQGNLDPDDEEIEP